MRTARITSSTALGSILRESRNVRGLTQDQLAEDLGVNRRYIIELESGKPTKALERLFEYMRATGVSLYGEISDNREPERSQFFSEVADG